MAERPWRNPWQVAGGLVVLIGALALLFPKPEAIDDDAPRIDYMPPKGYTPTTELTLSQTRCITNGVAQEACRLMGVEGGKVVHLFVQWDLTELRRRPGTFRITDAWVELIENHQAHYEGPVTLLPATGPEVPAGAGLVEGGRVDLRTLRLPLAETSEPLNALVASWLNQPETNQGVYFRVSPEAASSIDEFTPTLRFAYQIVE